MVAFAEKATFDCFACYRVKQSLLPRGMDKPGEGGGAGAPVPEDILTAPNTACRWGQGTCQ